MKIALIGFMGSGKSAIASYMKKTLNWEVIEMDTLLEEREKCTISEIFSEKGEEYFRNLETELLREIQYKERIVISCGGGVPLKWENVELMKKNGKIILLQASPETIFNRIRGDRTRPLLKNNMSLIAISSMMEKREKIYKEAADITVTVDGKTVEQIFAEIQEHIESWK